MDEKTVTGYESRERRKPGWKRVYEPDADRVKAWWA
jgi:hypothetical protein